MISNKTAGRRATPLRDLTRPARVRRALFRAVLAVGVTAGMTTGMATGLAGIAAAQQPLSANDWVAGKSGAPGTSTGWRPSDGVPGDATLRRPPTPRPDNRTPSPGANGEPGTARPVTHDARPSPVTVTRLGKADPDAAGVRSARSAGLPAGLWDGATVAEVTDAIRDSAPRLPATRALLSRILTAQLIVPARGDVPQGALLLTRVDRLIEAGNLPVARAMLQAAGPDDAGLFARSFSLSMLTGDDLRACSTLAKRPGLARDMTMRVYCLALNGDWGAAALTLEGAEAMGRVDPATADLLARYLDDSFSDVSDALPEPSTVTPLAFHLHEAIGQPLATGPLPLIFAWSDLGPNGGWKLRLEAAERLARAGVLSQAQLVAIYTEQRPAASGGVWDRAASLQAVLTALDAGDNAGLMRALPAALDRFAQAGLAPQLAAVVGPKLPEVPPQGPAGNAVATLRLLAGLPVQSEGAEIESYLRWTADVAAGRTPTDPAPDDAMGRAQDLADALGPTQPANPDTNPASAGAANAGAAAPDQLAPEAGSGLGALRAMADVDAGLDGDADRAARGLRALSDLGYASVARQAMIELIILPQLSPTR